MTLYQIDAKSLADMNNHIWWQTSIEENWTHLQFVQLSLYCTQIKTYDKEYPP